MYYPGKYCTPFTHLRHPGYPVPTDHPACDRGTLYDYINGYAFLIDVRVRAEF